MTVNSESAPARSLPRIVAGGALLIVVLGALGWWLVGQRVWTDDRSIRLPDSAVEVREILWTKPQPMDEALGTAASDSTSKDAAINTDADEYEPSISPDGTELFFVRGLPGEKKQSQADIYFSVRMNNRWSKPQPLTSINTPGNELGPRLSHDGQWLYFYSDREGGLGGYDIWASPRTDTGWGEAVNVGPAINSAHNEFNPAPTPDGQRIFFATNRKAAGALGDAQRWNATIRHNPSATDYDIFVAMAMAKDVDSKIETAGPALSQFEQAVEVTPLSSPFHEGSASVTSSGDFLYFTSNRDGIERGYDLYRCRLRPADARGVAADNSRIVAGLYFEQIEKLSELNSPVDEADPSLASQGFRLLFSSNASTGQGGYDLYVADSREVFVDRDARHLPALGWSWWVLLAAVGLLLLLLFLFRKIDSEKLGLLQKCVIVSLFVHLIITILLSFFWLTKEVYEQAVEQEKEMRIAMNLDATTEMDLRMATRSQKADLPVSAPAISELAPQTTPIEVTHAAPMRQIEIDIPTARSAPSESSMVLPSAAKASPPSTLSPTAKANLPEASLMPSVTLPQVSPLRPVTASSAPDTAEPTPVAQQLAAAVNTQASTTTVPAPSPSQAQAASTAAAPAPARAVPTTQAAMTPPASSAPVAAAPAPAARFETQQVQSSQPAAMKVSDASTTAPQRTQVASSSAAESAPTDAPPSQAATAALAATSPSTAPAKATAQASSPAQAQAPASAQPIATLAMQSEPVRSSQPQGLRVTEATQAMAERAATQPESEAGQVVVDAPPSRSAENAAATAAQATPAKTTTESLASSAQALPLAQPSIDTQPTTSAKLAAEESTAPPDAQASSQALAQRMEQELTAPRAAEEAGSTPATTAPTAPSATSLAVSDRAPSQPATQAEKVESSSTSTPTAAPPDLAALPFASKAIAAVDAKQVESVDSKSPSTSTEPSAAAVADRSSEQPQNVDVLAPASTKSNVQGLAQSATESRAQSKAVAAISNATATVPGPMTPFEVELVLNTQSGKVTGKNNELLEQADDAASPSLNKASSPSTTTSAANTQDSASRFLPATDTLASLTGKQSSADIRAKVATIATTAASEPVLAPLSEALGPSQFASPAPLFQRSPAMREKLLEEMGGTPESEDAVSRALAYLSRNQEPDGRWTFITPGDRGPGKREKYLHDTALTALAVLTFLGADHTPIKPGPYQEQVARAIEYLIKRGNDQGDYRGDGNMYDQGIVGIALAEAALMTGDTKTREAAIAASRFIAKAQDPKSGGWRYRPGEYGDTSVLGWQVMAMHSAEQLGYEISADIRERAGSWLKLVTQKNTLLSGYQQEGPRPSMTAEALFSRILLGETFSEKHLRTFEQFMFDNPAGKGETDFYYLYYATLSFNQLQGPNWKKWNDKTRPFITKLQRRGGADDGSWNMVNRWDKKGGQVYTTCMAALTLEVYYRYLPMYGGAKRTADNE